MLRVGLRDASPIERLLDRDPNLFIAEQATQKWRDWILHEFKLLCLPHSQLAVRVLELLLNRHLEDLVVERSHQRVEGLVCLKRRKTLGSYADKIARRKVARHRATATLRPSSDDSQRE